MQLIVFTKDSKYYGIRTENVGEIIKSTKIFHVPQAQPWIEGLINLRGTIVTLVNFSKFLKEDDNGLHENIIVIMNDNQKIGILVEQIIGVFSVDSDEIQALDKKTNDNIEGIISIHDKLTNIIDVMTIFTENEGSI
ncbi:chemotaxis protein CheW [Vagococcus carniphilus]|uniref:Chemotaxis protein CheW n=1 Tax=Vagococcus carniphilus TaxID=218144 RepID=A0A430B4V1_9ENTE|nr:chemotaxis protein CheW [Vagococcus carniphilus]MDT2815849.1 chemotaxis protein CheW [Vagococcus carniphilus]MDT2829640.1 chemotaxis protein CheW [Vagococcus carniphilus]MDT2833658.1 chemotaxis protein CheW [Vagococcus carniphilus]MDT2839099.1 chemotaxis protein CheW [Vagococcus carniphilus]MDT2847611.1 chemotaxis protein CheW [Vagococcus carniphilus]